MAASAHATTPPANENGLVVRLTLLVSDPEVARELAEHEEGATREEFAKQALRVGVLAMRQASGSLDAGAIQREADRMLGAVRDALSAHATQTATSMTSLLRGYFDPQTGSLPQRLDRLTKRDGDIESVLTRPHSTQSPASVVWP